MIQPLYCLVFGEVAVILLLLFHVLMLLDRLKQGRGPGGTSFVILVPILFSITSIKQRSVEAGSINPTDQVLLAYHLLEASLLGFALFLRLMIDKEVRMLRKYLQAIKMSDQKSEDVKSKDKGKGKAIQEEED